ncbi:HAMP domain-containing histidine kinase [Erysipelotrichaceae bacterium OttesenSCG-928-M19]|nr:HAMP domain-containing histidine kinase [Erysipelotrichaceae bacterium OttesenSCG-928-M19]
MSKLFKEKIWRVIIYIGIIVCIIISILITLRINDIPDNYYTRQRTEIRNIETQIKENVTTNNFSVLEDLVANNSMELKVYDSTTNELVYSSLPNEAVESIKGKLNENAINYETAFVISDGETEYEVWWLLYNVMPQSSFDYVITLIITVGLFMLALILLLLIILYLKFLLPLRNLKTNIERLSEFKLDELKNETDSSEYGKLNQNLLEFGKELDTIITETGYQYTRLESSLQLQNEKLIYQNRFIASLTHNLKTPIVTVKHLLEKEQLQQEALVTKKLDNLVDDINDISKLVYHDNEEAIRNKTQFNLTSLVRDVYNIYEDNFLDKKLVVEFDIDDEVMVYDYHLQYKQLIHNAISNIIKYTKENAYVKIGCFIEQEYIYLQFYNDAKKMSESELDNIFKLFYRISKDKEGLGTGLYTIRAVAEELNGTVDFKNYDDGVMLEYKKRVEHNEVI